MFSRFLALIVFLSVSAYEINDHILGLISKQPLITAIGLFFVWITTSIMQHEKTIFSGLKFTVFGKVEFFPIFVSIVSYFLFINLKEFALLGFALDGYTAEVYAQAANSVIMGIGVSIITITLIESLLHPDKSPRASAFYTSIALGVILWTMSSLILL
jgi:hypothetical protein